MKKVTQSRLNAIYNAGTMIQALDFGSELSQKELDEHEELGQLMIDNAEEVLRLLLKLRNNE